MTRAVDERRNGSISGCAPTTARMAPFILGLLAILLTVCSPVHAVEPDEILKDAALETRARAISQKLRCVVCQNQSIDDSNAPLARDLRVLVRERLTAGDSDTQTVGYIVQRYGNFVLLKPPVQVNTLLLWIGPLLLAVLAAFGFSRYLSRQAGMSSPTATETFTIEEEERLRSLLGKSAAATRTPKGETR